MPHTVEYWIDLALYDLETAQAMLNTKRYLYVGYMCHLSVEKMLKAYFVFMKHTQPPFIHSLRKLANDSGLSGDFSEDQIELLETLQPLNIEARYPTYKDELMRSLNEDTCKNILAQTKEIVAWIENRLSK